MDGKRAQFAFRLEVLTRRLDEHGHVVDGEARERRIVLVHLNREQAHVEFDGRLYVVVLG